jgi:hypothetical protein
MILDTTPTAAELTTAAAFLVRTDATIALLDRSDDDGEVTVATLTFVDAPGAISALADLTAWLATVLAQGRTDASVTCSALAAALVSKFPAAAAGSDPVDARAVAHGQDVANRIVTAIEAFGVNGA